MIRSEAVLLAKSNTFRKLFMLLQSGEFFGFRFEKYPGLIIIIIK